MPEGPLEALDRIAALVFRLSPVDRIGAGEDYATLRRHLEPQPIESAPRDGTRVLASGRDWGTVIVCHFCESCEAWHPDYTDEENLTPNVWLPLPAPANQEGRT